MYFPVWYLQSVNTWVHTGESCSLWEEDTEITGLTVTCKHSNKETKTLLMDQLVFCRVHASCK